MYTTPVTQTSNNKIIVLGKKTKAGLTNFLLVYLKSFLRSKDLTKKHLIVTFFKSLKPISTEITLQRIGEANDGGYLVPSNYLNSCGLISPGTGDTISFDVDLTNGSMPGILIDGSVESPKNLPMNLKFLKKYLGISGQDNVSLPEIIETYFPKCKDLILSMDIEGAEYEVLNSISIHDLIKFRIIVIELHWLHRILNIYDYAKVFEPSVKKLLDNFYVLHFHCNNAGGFFYFRGMKFPRVIELTLIRKDCVEYIYGSAELPHKLDAPNNPNFKDISLPSCI